jgi:[ribosomal protein S5]-alanine N-acetyltransferase
MDKPKDIIVTSRLCLRSPLPADLQPLHENVLSDAAVMSLALTGKPMTPAQSLEFFQDNFDHDASGKKLGILIEQASGQAIGFAGLLPCDALGEADYELGFVLRRSAWGQGYATEIGRGQLDYGFDVLGLKRLLALVSPANQASMSALQKIGMKRHGTVNSAQRGDRHIYIVQNR